MAPIASVSIPPTTFRSNWLRGLVARIVLIFGFVYVIVYGFQRIHHLTISDRWFWILVGAFSLLSLLYEFYHGFRRFEISDTGLSLETRENVDLVRWDRVTGAERSDEERRPRWFLALTGEVHPFTLEMRPYSAEQREQIDALVRHHLAAAKAKSGEGTASKASSILA